MPTRPQMRDPSSLAAYALTTTELITEHGGRFEARGGAMEPQGQGARPRAIVVLESRTMAPPRGRHADPADAPPVELRAPGADPDVVLVDGV